MLGFINEWSSLKIIYTMTFVTCIMIVHVCIRKKQTQVAFQIMQLIFVDIKFMFHEIKDYVIRFN